MTQTRREHLCVLAGWSVASSGVARAEERFGKWTDAQKEKFLLTATIVSAAEIGHGVTKPVRLELQSGAVKHAAKVQVVNKDLPDFFPPGGKTPIPMRDSWKYNIASYKLDRLLGLNMVTVEVARPYRGKPAGYSWWVDDVMFEEVDRIKKDIPPPDPEAFDRQRMAMRVFDELIINIDRNLSNILITKSWNIALIDHSRSFNAYPDIRNRENLTRCGRQMLVKLRSLNAAELEKALGKHLTAEELKGLLSRRDRIVEHFEQRVKEQGERNVLFG